MMKRQFSSHIMPQRMARQFLWALAEVFFLYVIFKMTAVVWRSLLYEASGPLLLWLLLLVCAMAAFPAYWERVRLYRNAAMRSVFMESFADGSYDKKQDSQMLWRCDALWNDVVIFAVLYLIVLLYGTLWRFLISVITDPSMWYEETDHTACAADPVLFAVCRHVCVLASPLYTARTYKME